MARRIMRTFDRVELSDYAVPDEVDSLTLDGIAELLFVVNNRGRARWAFSRVERVPGDPYTFLLHFIKTDHE